MEKKYALISLSDKSNLSYLVASLKQANYTIIATTSSASAIKDLGYEVTLVEEITSFPEMLNGRVKTLQPEIHGGILADLSKQEHIDDLKKFNINPISIVVCNLYPFEEVLNEYYKRIDNCELNRDEIVEYKNKLIENIDIGGVTLIRAAAKNYKFVSILTNPEDYGDFVKKFNEDKLDEEYRKSLAVKGFIHTSRYDSMISNYFMEDQKNKEQLIVNVPISKVLRYGENPHQQASFYLNEQKMPYSLNTSRIIQGKELSYNNILDIDSAYKAIVEFDTPCAIALKHNTPCGIGIANNIADAYLRCYDVDSKSIFGGVVILNREVDEVLAKKLNETFLEIIIAPKYTSEAIEEFSKKTNLRIIEGDFDINNYVDNQLRSVRGGYLSQTSIIDEFELKNVTTIEIDEKTKQRLAMLYKAVKNVKSNAIVIGQEDLVLGISGGMVSRVDACEHALKAALYNEKYNKDIPLLLSSDGFFPFNDIIKLAVENNIKYIIQPGGSMNDQKFIEECNKNGIGAIFTKVRFFRH